jgi:hypothetical protein
VPSWLSFATHLADRRGLFAKNPLSQVQDFLLKVDMALTMPTTARQKELATLRRDIGIALVARGADPKKIFPVLVLSDQPVPVRGEEIIDHQGPAEIISTMTAAEAAADLELLLRAERAGALNAADLLTITENTNGDHPS